MQCWDGSLIRSIKPNRHDGHLLPPIASWRPTNPQRVLTMLECAAAGNPMIWYGKQLVARAIYLPTSVASLVAPYALLKAPGELVYSLLGFALTHTLLGEQSFTLATTSYSRKGRSLSLAGCASKIGERVLESRPAVRVQQDRGAATT